MASGLWALVSRSSCHAVDCPFANKNRDKLIHLSNCTFHSECVIQSLGNELLEGALKMRLPCQKNHERHFSWREFRDQIDTSAMAAMTNVVVHNPQVLQSLSSENRFAFIQDLVTQLGNSHEETTSDLALGLRLLQVVASDVVRNPRVCTVEEMGTLVLAILTCNNTEQQQSRSLSLHAQDSISPDSISPDSISPDSISPEEHTSSNSNQEIDNICQVAHDFFSAHINDYGKTRFDGTRLLRGFEHLQRIEDIDGALKEGHYAGWSAKSACAALWKMIEALAESEQKETLREVFFQHICLIGVHEMLIDEIVSNLVELPFGRLAGYLPDTLHQFKARINHQQELSYTEEPKIDDLIYFMSMGNKCLDLTYINDFSINLHALYLCLQNTHRQQALSSEGSLCWFRAAWLTILSEGYTQQNMSSQSLLVQLPSEFSLQANRITDSQLPIYNHLLQRVRGRNGSDWSNPSRIRLPIEPRCGEGVRTHAETILLPITETVLRQNGRSDLDLDRLFRNSEYGSDDDIAMIVKRFGVSTLILSPASQQCRVICPSDCEFAENLQVATTPEACLNLITNYYDRKPVIINIAGHTDFSSGNHFDVLLPHG